jgi:hypothetical protein
VGVFSVSERDTERETERQREKHKEGRGVA